MRKNPYDKTLKGECKEYHVLKSCPKIKTQFLKKKN